MLVKRFLQFGIIILAVSCFGCATSSKSAQDDRIKMLQVNSEQFDNLDAQLDQLEQETEAVSEDYAKVEAQVISRISLNVDKETVAMGITAQINENNVLIIDSNIMSRNDFMIFADKYLPARCAVTPELVVDPNSDYGTAAWILEVFYSHGCANVTLK